MTVRTSRRAFFLRGGAVLGAGVASAAGATALSTSAPADDELSRLRAAAVEATDREALRALHGRFMADLTQRRFEAVTGLFAPDALLALSGERAQGAREIEHLLQVRYAQQLAETLHAAYRTSPSAGAAGETLWFSPDRREATASWPGEAELCTPLRGTSTLAQMAKLQGNVADRHWESGRFEARYARTGTGWRIAALEWRRATV